MKIEPTRVFDHPISVYCVSKAATLLHFEPKWNVLDDIADLVKELRWTLKDEAVKDFFVAYCIILSLDCR